MKMLHIVVKLHLRHVKIAFEKFVNFLSTQHFFRFNEKVFTFAELF